MQTFFHHYFSIFTHEHEYGVDSKISFISYRFDHQSDLLNINTKIIEFLSLTDQLLELEN